MENYEKKYKEALETARKINSGEGVAAPEGWSTLEVIFPELKESEDERIRKEIIHLIKKSNEYGGYALHKDEADRMISWLEKQGKQANKIEPKFKVGDWILIDNPCQIESIDSNGNYIVQYCDAEETHLLSKNFCDSHFHLWTIQDAKDGDVIEFADHEKIVIGIVSHVNKVTGKVDVNCLLDGNNFKLGIYYALDTIKPHPATKEQCDLLFQKIEEAGYKWDVEKKKLKKIEQNLAWSEEDETTLACLLGTLTWATRNNYHCAEDIPKYMRWLETLKQRLNGTK